MRKQIALLVLSLLTSLLLSPQASNAVEKLGNPFDVKVAATKKGAKPKTLTLSVDADGELFVPTTASLKGFQLQIKRGSKLIKAIKLS